MSTLGQAWAALRAHLSDEAELLRIVDTWPVLCVWDAETGGSLAMLEGSEDAWARLRADPAVWGRVVDAQALTGPLHSYLTFRLTRGVWHCAAALPLPYPDDVVAPEPWPGHDLACEASVVGRPLRLRCRPTM